MEYMPDAPLVSVLMTTYNREKYIHTAIQSVLASTFTNFELIISDDGSTDNTIPIAKQYAEKDSRVKIFLNEKNLGDYPNRNKAASLAKGKYIKYVDADDYIYPWGLQILVTCMEAHPDAGFGLCSLIQYIGKPFPFMLTPKEAYEYHYFGPGVFHKAPLSCIIKKEAFDVVKGFKPIRMAGDYEMWHRMGQQFNVVLMCDGVVWYREHDAQESNDTRLFIKVYEEIKVGYLNDENCPLDKNQVALVKKQTRRKIIKRLILAVVKMNFTAITDNWVQLKFYI